MRVVIKIGTSTLAHASGRLNIRRVELLCKILSDLKNAGHQLVLVTSGAIGMGVGKLGLPGRPADMPGKQAAAAVGQCELMYVYDKLFSEYHHAVAQLLLTADDLRDSRRSGHVRDSLERLVEADWLILLSDIDGLYTADPRSHPDAELIPVVEALTPEILALAGGAGSALGSGGMTTKLRAAGIAMEAGVEMIIANGERPEVLYEIFEGKAVGTRFLGKGRAE